MKLFYPWNYKTDLMEINVRSAAGIHLVKRTLFGIQEQQDKSAAYHYLFDCRDGSSLTELLYEKQGWEKVCSLGRWVWYRKKFTDGAPAESYRLYRGDTKDTVSDGLRTLASLLDRIRNIILILCCLALLVSGFFAESQLVRLLALPVFLCIPLTKWAGSCRVAVGDEKPKEKK